MKPIIRFSPSPTGFLHIGNVRIAFFNFCFAKKNDGKFILRYDDTDFTRVKQEFVENIPIDLEWLGIKYDESFKQSERLERYGKIAAKLIASGRLYECYESEEEIEIQRKNLAKQGRIPIYNRASMRLTEEQKNDYQKHGRKPYYRFLLNDEEVSWNDLGKGPLKFSGLHFSDPVLVRQDGSPTYTFCSVVDDYDCKITHIIRGEDHITNTAIQIQIFRAIEDVEKQKLREPQFCHLPLIKTKDGKISKRIGGFGIKDLRNDGVEAIAILNLLNQLGSSDGKIYDNINEMVENFSIENFSKSIVIYDPENLYNINKKIISLYNYQDIKDRIGNFDEEFFNIIKGNITKLSEIKDWAEVCFGKLRYKNTETEYLKIAAAKLPENLRAEEAYKNWIDSIKSHSDKKGKELFLPLRLAITGREDGPELKNLLKIIPRDEVLARLNA